MQLVIGNKNYSSWSLRPWLLLTQAGIAFEERKVRFDAFTPESNFKTELARVTPTGCVPVLIDGDLTIWDTLAIAEYVAEKFPAKRLWPQEAAARARARSVCAEMHSGFGALRQHFPTNIEASLPEVGRRMLAGQPDVRADVGRIIAMWTDLLDSHGGPLLFGEFTIADAYFAPVVMRLRTYGVPMPPMVAAYMDRVVELSGMAAWIRDALAEHDFRAFEEPYRTQA